MSVGTKPPVQRISASELTPELFRHHQVQAIPIVLTDVIHPKWDWHLDYLCDYLGTQDFILRHYGKERYQQDKRTWTTIGSGVAPQSRSFMEYAELLRNGTAQKQDLYLAKCSIHNTNLFETEAIQTIGQYLNHLGLKAVSTLNLWVGPGGHTEALHYDPTDGTLMQLHGTKRVVLFPPNQTANLYPYSIWVHLQHGLKLRSWFSQVYVDRPDFRSFPKLETALRHRYEIKLHQGEILYIPAGWWHEVTALGDGMVCSVNRFWQVYPAKRALLSCPRWRAYLGSLCALPNIAFSLVTALLSRQRKQKLKEILQLF